MVHLSSFRVALGECQSPEANQNSVLRRKSIEREDGRAIGQGLFSFHESQAFVIAISTFHLAHVLRLTGPLNLIQSPCQAVRYE